MPDDTAGEHAICSHAALTGTLREPEQRAFMRKCVERVFAEGAAIREPAPLAAGCGHDVIGEYSFWPGFDGKGKVVA